MFNTRKETLEEKNRAKNMLKSFLLSNKGFVKTVFAEADEPVTPPVTPPTPEGSNPEPKTPTYDFDAMIKRAREEEKAKLYPQLDKAKEEARKFKELNNENLLEIARLKEEIEKLKNQDGESEEVTNLKAQVEDLTSKLEESEKNKPDEEEIRKQLQEEFKVKEYRLEQINANKDNILSVFLEEVSGNTNEEVDASIQKAIEKSNKVLEETGASKKEKKPATKKPPVVNPAIDQNDDDELSAEDIRNLDPSSKEYKELRKKLGLK